ncbi:MAG: hypothetical protein ACOCXP_03560 [Candidatus Dojkabacteria bacterium]
MRSSCAKEAIAEKIKTDPEDHSEVGWFTREEYAALPGIEENDPEAQEVLSGFAKLPKLLESLS